MKDIPESKASIQFNLEASHTTGSGKNKKTVVTHREQQRIPCGPGEVTEAIDTSESAKDFLMQVCKIYFARPRLGCGVIVVCSHATHRVTADPV